MLKIEYKDELGRKFLVAIPEGYEDEPETGIKIGPPDLDGLNLDEKHEALLNNQLYDRKLFTWSDVRRRPDEIRAALMATFKADVVAIMNLYKEENKDA